MYSLRVERNCSSAALLTSSSDLIMSRSSSNFANTSLLVVSVALSRNLNDFSTSSLASPSLCSRVTFSASSASFDLKASVSILRRASSWSAMRAFLSTSRPLVFSSIFCVSDSCRISNSFLYSLLFFATSASSLECFSDSLYIFASNFIVACSICFSSLVCTFASEVSKRVWRAARESVIRLLSDFTLFSTLVTLAFKASNLAFSAAFFASISFSSDS
mmetsp:Transcript_38143/g.98494  ORF Transcript_38143/g.98494 Transcript_38143/m.98494 type:complete len:218 (-) Transcript_38143:400-1053(-)